MQATGDRIAAATELAARMQGGQDDLNGGALLQRVLVHGNAATVVHHAYAAVGEENDIDAIAIAGQCLVDRVVDDLVHQVVEAPLAGRAHIHTWALAYCLESLQYGDRPGVVLDAVVVVGHYAPIRRSAR